MFRGLELLKRSISLYILAGKRRREILGEQLGAPAAERSKTESTLIFPVSCTAVTKTEPNWFTNPKDRRITINFVIFLNNRLLQTAPSVRVFLDSIDDLSAFPTLGSTHTALEIL